MASREELVAENEALFRDINERVVALPERQEASATEKLMFYCECGDLNCFEHVRLTSAQSAQSAPIARRKTGRLR